MKIGSDLEKEESEKWSGGKKMPYYSVKRNMTETFISLFDSFKNFHNFIRGSYFLVALKMSQGRIKLHMPLN